MKYADLNEVRIACREDKYEAWLTEQEAADCRRVLGVTLAREESQS